MTETPEKIVLTRSGLALTKGLAGALVAPGSDVRLALDTRPAGGCPIAWVRNDAGHVFETNEAAIGWLDARVLSLRSALLAGAEDTIIAALRERGMSADEDDARAVLAALCGEESK